LGQSSSHGSKCKTLVSATLAVMSSVLITTGASGASRVVAYYRAEATNNLPCTNLDYSQMTHIAHAFLWPNADGSLDVTSDFKYYPKLVETAHAHGVKIVISVGGGASGPTNFSLMASTAVTRSNFVQRLTAFCISNNYDGADFDWEGPRSATDRTNYTLLVQQTRAAFDAAKTNMTVSLAIKRTARDGQWLDIDQLKDNVDWFGVMTYNFHTVSSRESGHTAPLYASPSEPHGPTYSVDAAVKYYLDRGVPRPKLLMGFLFHGYQFTSTNLWATNTGAISIPYSKVVSDLSNGWTRVWDDVSQVPYLIDSNHTHVITYDDPQSVQGKCDYAARERLGGAIIWPLGGDAHPGATNELLNVIGRNFLPGH
jgi:chitinase